MKTKHICTTLRSGAGCILLIGILAATVSYGAISFTVDAGSVGTPDDIYNPGAPPPGAGPVSIIAGTAPPAGVDAISYGHQVPDESTIYFSVDAASVGVPGSAVNMESLLGEQAGDVFFSALNNTNGQAWDGNGSSAPALGFAEPGPDNMDGLDMRGGSVPPGNIYFSVDAATSGGGHPAYGPGTTGADIWVAPAAANYSGAPALYAPSAALGLQPTDELDALVVVEDGVPGFTQGDFILFSLAPASPTLAILAASPADVMSTTAAGGPAVFIAHPILGLLPTDNIDALDVVPEPGYAILALGVGALFFAWFHRRRRLD